MAPVSAQFSSDFLLRENFRSRELQKVIKVSKALKSLENQNGQPNILHKKNTFREACMGGGVEQSGGWGSKNGG